MIPKDLLAENTFQCSEQCVLKQSEERVTVPPVLSPPLCLSRFCSHALSIVCVFVCICVCVCVCMCVRKSEGERAADI